MSQPQLRMNFAGARIFKDEESAKAYYRAQGMSEEQLAQLHFLPADRVPLRVRRKAIRDESMRTKTTRNQRRLPPPPVPPPGAKPPPRLSGIAEGPMLPAPCHACS